MAWAAVGGAAVSVIGGLFGKKSKAPTATSAGTSGFPGLLSSYMTAKQGQEMAGARDKAVAMADPFAKSRQLANTQLQSLMQNPGQMANDPSYQWAVQQGGQAVDRSLAAKHMTASGGALQELSQWGQGLASQNYNQRLAQLSAMASQGASPSSAASAELQGTQLSQGLMSAGAAGGLSTLQGAAGDIGDAISSAGGHFLGGLFGGGGGNQGSTGMTGFQNTSYNPWFQSQPTGGSLDYSTSFGTTPNYSGSTSLSGSGFLSGMY